MAQILIVHRDKGLRTLLQKTLSPHYEILCAADAVTALDMAQRNPPHLVIFGLWMDHIDGLDLAHALRTLYPHLPLITFGAAEPHQSRMFGLLKITFPGAGIEMEQIVDLVRSHL